MPTAHRAPRKHSLRGWFQGGGWRALHDGGWGTITTPSQNKVPLWRGVARYRTPRCLARSKHH